MDKLQYNDIISYMRLHHIISHINHATSQQYNDKCQRCVYITQPPYNIMTNVDHQDVCHWSLKQ